MTCTHEIYSRFIGCESDPDGVEWCIVGCRECEATMKFPAQARLARKYAEVRADYKAGLSATEIAAKHGYQSRGIVVNLLARLGVTMRDRTTARLMAMAKKAPPDFNQHEKIENLDAHFALCNELRIAKP